MPVKYKIEDFTEWLKDKEEIIIHKRNRERKFDKNIINELKKEIQEGNLVLNFEEEENSFLTFNKWENYERLDKNIDNFNNILGVWKSEVDARERESGRPWV